MECKKVKLITKDKIRAADYTAIIRLLHETKEEILDADEVENIA